MAGHNGNPNSLANLGTPFSAENQPECRGRKKRLYSKLKDNGLSQDDIKALAKLILDLSYDELKAAIKGNVPEDIRDLFDGQVPAAFNIMATALLGDMSRRNLYNFEQLLSRLYGKPVAHNETSLIGEDGGPVEISLIKRIIVEPRT